MTAPWPIWIISLPDATHRKSCVTQDFSRLGIDFSFLDAIDGRKGLPPHYECLVDRPGTIAREGKPMSDGEYACALSHQKAYARIIDEGLGGAIIMEDDAIPTEDFRAFYLSHTYKEFPLVQMYYPSARVWRGSGKKYGRIRMLRISENSFGAVGYSISREAARHLRENGLPVTNPADWPCDLAKIGAVITVPRILRHPERCDEQSTLAESRGAVDLSGFDPNRNFKKGWRRIFSVKSWKRLAMKKASRMVYP